MIARLFGVWMVGELSINVETLIYFGQIMTGD